MAWIRRGGATTHHTAANMCCCCWRLRRIASSGARSATLPAPHGLL